jgi:hypothetical protein
MKVIGKTSEGFITTVSNEEVKALLSINDSRKKEKFDEIKVGTDLTFTVALTNLNLLKDLRLTGNYRTLHELLEAKNELQKAIDIVTKTDIALLEVQKIINESQS